MLGSVYNKSTSASGKKQNTNEATDCGCQKQTPSGTSWKIPEMCPSEKKHERQLEISFGNTPSLATVMGPCDRRGWIKTNIKGCMQANAQTDAQRRDESVALTCNQIYGENPNGHQRGQWRQPLPCSDLVALHFLHRSTSSPCDECSKQKHRNDLYLTCQINVVGMPIRILGPGTIQDGLLGIAR